MNSKVLVIFFIAVLINCTFLIFWKKSMDVVSPSILTIAIGISALIIGLLSTKVIPWEIKPNQEQNLWMIPVAVIAVSIFYLVMGHILTTVHVSKIYPLLSISTIICVALAGWFFIDEPMGFKKIVGIMFGVISVWLILDK